MIAILCSLSHYSAHIYCWCLFNSSPKSISNAVFCIFNFSLFHSKLVFTFSKLLTLVKVGILVLHPEVSKDPESLLTVLAYYCMLQIRDAKSIQRASTNTL